MKLITVLCAGFKTFEKETYIGPLDSSFSAIVGPNGIGKTVIADAVRFTLTSSVAISNMRVKRTAEAVNHTLVSSQGSAACCITEVGLSIQSSERQPTERVYLAVRKRARASGECNYYAAKLDHLPTSDTWTATMLTPMRLV
jgi:structural maintenance of chromosome 4